MNKFKPIRITNMWTEMKDYLFITLGLILYSFGWAGFLIPNKITTGGVTGISAIVYYATDIPIQNTYVLINIVLLIFALKILGWKFCVKTIYGIAVLYVLLWFFQRIIVDDQGQALSLVGDEPFMACIIGAALCGIGLGMAFTHNGSTGGTDIIAAIVNKYRDVTFGRMTMLCDICIISSSSFIPPRSFPATPSRRWHSVTVRSSSSGSASTTWSTTPASLCSSSSSPRSMRRYPTPSSSRHTAA